MKILYAIQGTGNGHVSRAREIIPYLKAYGHVDIFLSGNNSNVELNEPVKYRSKGVSFYYDKSGSIDYVKTFLKLRMYQTIKEVRDFPIKDYDLVINDFEFISSWAARLRNVPVIGFGHQAALLSSNVPKPKGINLMGELILHKYAPANHKIGLHFEEYDDFIFKPIIRSEIRKKEPRERGHYTVYLPAYGDRFLINMLRQIQEVEWHVFSKYARVNYAEGNVKIFPASNEAFIHSMVNCNGLLTNAGFESPAEALYLGKKLFVIPINRQYEQQCNAEALKKIGVPVSYQFQQKTLERIRKWIAHGTVPKVYYPDITEKMIENILTNNEPYLIPSFI
ncbi:MAG: glycosyltransferase family protein [Flavobacteriales bacterium]